MFKLHNNIFNLDEDWKLKKVDCCFVIVRMITVFDASCKSDTLNKCVHSLNGVLDAGDSEESSQICRVGGDDYQSKEPPNPHHHPCSQSRVGHLTTCRETGEKSKQKRLMIVPSLKLHQTCELSKYLLNKDQSGKMQPNLVYFIIWWIKRVILWHFSKMWRI